MSVSFEEDTTMISPRAFAREENIKSPLIRFFLKNHIGKNAQTIMLGLAVIGITIISLSLILFYRTVSQNTTIPFNQLPKNIQEKFPESVQKLHENKK